MKAEEARFDLTKKLMIMMQRRHIKRTKNAREIITESAQALPVENRLHSLAEQCGDRVDRQENNQRTAKVYDIRRARRRSNKMRQAVTCRLV